VTPRDAKLSGGQKQRLALTLFSSTIRRCCSWTNRRAADPQARHEIHQLCRMARRAPTILLTTHHRRGQRFHDRVAIIDEGRIIAMGRPPKRRRGRLAPAVSKSACPRCA
jgi:ABC-type multidrug transport system ATPase subunit